MTDAAEIAQSAYQFHGASQIKDELSQAILVMASAAPEIVLEIGCDRGGTLYAWKTFCPRVYGITLPDNTAPTGGQNLPLHHHGATVLLGDSHAPASMDWLKRELRGALLDVLVIDGDHSYDGVAADWATYTPLVRAGGLIFIHDVLNVNDPRVDVPRFWSDLNDGVVLASRVEAVKCGWGVIEKKANG